MRLLAISSLASFGLLALACTNSASEPTSHGEAAVTGVTDFTAVEAEFGLVKDVQDAQGQWARSDAKLASGPCYARTVGGPNGASFEFRRYKQGAAFFSKIGPTPTLGDDRPIRCLDLDVTPPQKGDPAVSALAGIALDTAMRFHLGKITGGEAGLGHEYFDFERGMVEISGAAHYCGIQGDDDDHSPGSEAFNQALANCKVQGSATNDACYGPAEAACEAAAAKDIVQNTIDRPAFDATDTDAPTYFYSAQIPDGSGQKSAVDLSGNLISAVYRYASKIAAAGGEFTLANDPVGKYQSNEWAAGQSTAEYTEHVRFEKMDAHHVVTPDFEQLAITPKGSDATIAQSAVVFCSRTYNSAVGATGDFVCRGL